MKNNLLLQDQHHRERALNPAESFIIQAPAGSGKTELIIQRFLTLLAHVKKPEEILAITFTKKSAHEMRTRVLKALDQAVHQPEPAKAHEKLTWRLATAVLKRDGELNWDLVNNPNQLHIKTIDSFCTYLTGQLPLLSHFGSQPDIANFSQYLHREAVLEVLSHIEEDHPWSPTVARLLAHTDNDVNKLSELLINMLEKRDQWQKYLFSGHDTSDADMRRMLTNQIAAVVNFTLQNHISQYPEIHAKELLALLRFGAENLAGCEADNLIAAMRDITSMPKASADHLIIWQAIAEFLLTKKNEWRKKVTDDIGFPALNTLEKSEEPLHRAMRTRHKNLIASLAANEKLLDALIMIRKLPPAEYTDKQWAALKALLEVLKITLAQLRVTFQLHGQIDFIQNAEGASLALGDKNNPTDLALSLDYQIRHILVDEFQDTSSTQHGLLEKLTHGWQINDGRTLFVVGDPMQSIYRFRQAEVGIFIRMQEEGIGDLRLTPLTLSVNFRSTTQIVEWNNQQFTSIFPENSNIGTGAVHFNPSIANQAAALADHSQVTLNGFLEGNDRAQSDAVIQFIQETLHQYPDEKIAILVRSRPHLAAIIPALKAAGLRYNALEIDPLITRQSIQDCLSLTRALIHPADRIAWLALLRAPWCGLTLSDLLQLCRHHKSAMIWEQLNHPAAMAGLSSDGQARIQAILPILQAAINNRERAGFREWIEHTWLALGGPAALSDYAEIADINEFLDLLTELSSDGQRINLETLNERMTQLRATASQDDALIQIMTIHSAKGLEFDTVILPHLEKATTNDDKSILLWMEHPLHADRIALLLAPLHAAGSEKDALYAYIESTQKTKSNYEVDRLFYVAATRAKKRLHLVFNVKEGDKTGNSSFLSKLWPHIKHTVQLTEAASPQSAAMTNSNDTTHNIVRFTAGWKNPVAIHYPDEQSSYQTKNGFQLPDHSLRIIGTVTHLILQQLFQQGIAWWKMQSSTEIISYITRQLNKSGLSPDKHDRACQSIHDIIMRTITDEKGRWILEAHDDAHSEFKLTIATKNGCENIIIDRTFIDENQVRWIIDYKTAETQDDDINIFLQKQKAKHSEQMMKYKHAISLIDSRPIKTGLYFPSLPAWCET